MSRVQPYTIFAPGLRGKHVPALRLAEGLMFDALRVGVVGMHLHRKPVVRRDDLRQHRKDALGIDVAEQLGAESAPQVGDGAARQRAIGDGIGVPALPRLAQRAFGSPCLP